MRWFFPSAALGLLTLCGAHSLYGQTTGTAQSGAATRQGNTNAEGSATQSSDQVKARLRAGGQRDASERGGGYYPGDSDPWFFRDDLREELELDDDQIERLREIYNETRSGADARGTGEELRDQARAERMRELRNRFDDTFSERASSIFRDDNQRRRFNQLGLQYRGYSAFDDARLQRELNLNDTQRRQLRDLNNSWNTELETLRGTYASNRGETENRFNQLRERTRTNFEGILNDQQRTAYDEMIGNRFEFGADAFLDGNANNQAPRNNNQQAGTNGQGSGLLTPQDNGPQGSGLLTPQDNGPQGSGLGTPSGAAGGAGTNSGAGAGSGTGGSGSGSGSGS